MNFFFNYLYMQKILHSCIKFGLYLIKTIYRRIKLNTFLNEKKNIHMIILLNSSFSHFY